MMLAPPVSLLFAVIVAPPSAETVCRAPTSLTVDAGFKQAWMRTYCHDQAFSVGFVIPEANVPFQANQAERTCDNAGGSVASHRNTVETYIHSDPSIEMAECGYRICAMSLTGAPTDVMLSYIGLCGGASRKADGRTGGSYLAAPAQVFDWDATMGTPTGIKVTAPIEQSAGVSVRYRVEVDNADKQFLKFEHGPKPLPSGRTELEFSIHNLASVVPDSPRRLRYTVRLFGAGGTESALRGSFVIRGDASGSPSCTKWKADPRNPKGEPLCTACGFYADFSGGTGDTLSLRCPRMIPSQLVRARIESLGGDVFYTSPNDRGNAHENGVAFQFTFGLGGKPSVTRNRIHAPVSDWKNSRNVSLSLTGKSDDSGVAELTATLDHCEAPKGNNRCFLSGTVVIEEKP